MNSDTSLTDKETRVCEGCGHSWSAKRLKADGYVACCPERKMLTAREWYERAQAAEARARTAEDALKPALLVLCAMPQDNLNAAFRADIDHAIKAIRALSPTRTEG